MPTTLFLARHGETVWHAENRYAGRSDIPLTERGRAQAETLGAWARTASLDAIWASPLVRARKTAAPAARHCGLPVQVEPDLRELDFGELDGHTLAEFAARCPEAAAAYQADPVAHPPPGGEDPAEAAARGVAALRRIAATRPDGRVLVVFHNTLIRLVLCRLLGIPLRDYRRVFPRVRNCAVTELLVSDSTAALLAYNAPVT